LVTITGGKWTTYRNMAEDCVNRAAQIADLPVKPCATRHMRIHGYGDEALQNDHFSGYGADRVELAKLIGSTESHGERLHVRLPFVAGEVIWAIRYEMARTVDDVLARRTRALLLDANAAIEAAPTVARVMAEELGREESWQIEQVEQFRELARGYQFQS
jgi:glycerol-3-phosphate dehydrogenase